jgi:hypothetical protein
VGLILSLFSIFLNPASATITIIIAYSCLLAGLLLIIGSLLNQLAKILKCLKGNINMWAFFLLVKTNLGPFIVIAGILTYLLNLACQYQRRLSNGHLPDNYYLFSNFMIFLIVIEVFILLSAMYKNTNKDDSSKTSNLTNTKQMEASFKNVIPLMTSTFVYFLTTLNLILVIILRNMLLYFTTDGFMTLRNLKVAP